MGHGSLGSMTTTEKYNTKKDNAKNKSRLPAILLNADFYTKPRNIRWIKENGAEAVLILQAVWIASSQERDFKIKKEEASAIAFLCQYSEEKIQQVLESAVKLGLLEADEEYYFNSQIINDGTAYHSTRIRNTNKQRERREKDRLSRLHNSDIPSDEVGYVSETPINVYVPVNVNGSNNKNGEPERESPNPKDEWLDFALSKLEEPKKQAWTNSSIHMMGGHRPMKGYDKLFWRPQDLALVFKEWNDTVPKKLWKSGFLLAQSKVEATLQTGKKLEEIPLMSWFLTFVRTELLETATKQARHAKISQGELNG